MPAEFEATDTRSPDQRKQRFFWKCGPLGTYCLIVFPFLLVSLILINLTDQEQWLSLSLLSIGIVCVLSGLVTWWERNEVKEFIRFQFLHEA